MQRKGKKYFFQNISFMSTKNPKSGKKTPKSGKKTPKLEKKPQNHKLW